MTFHAMTEHYEEITVCGKPALFTSIRIKRVYFAFHPATGLQIAECPLFYF